MQKLYQQALIIRKEQIENNREHKRLKTLQEFASVVQAEQRKLNGNWMMERFFELLPNDKAFYPIDF